MAVFFCAFSVGGECFTTSCRKERRSIRMGMEQPEGGHKLGNRIISRELMELGDRIRGRRENAHLSQEALAEKAGISPNTLCRIEGGQMAMSIRTFMKLIKALGVDANQLLGEEILELGDEESMRDIVKRAKRLGQGEQGIVERTMKALVDGLERMG